MDVPHTKELTDRATASTTKLGEVVRQALTHPTLKLAAALNAGLLGAGYKLSPENHKDNRHRVHVHKGDELIAFGSSGTPELALEYAMLGAMREGK